MRSQYGASLSAETLDTLARGELVTELGLSQSKTYCTKNEFTLLLLLQQGIVSGDDIQRCREAFARLDADGSGRLDEADLADWQTKLGKEVEEEAAAAQK